MQGQTDWAAEQPRPLFGRVLPAREPAQLDLPLWPRETLAEALRSYRTLKLELCNIEPSTLRDYEEYFRWLTGYFGLLCPLREITFEALVRLYKKARKELRGVTIVKRFRHLLAAMKYAAERKIIGKDDVPGLPPIENDGRPGERVLELLEFEEFRLALAGVFRAYADIVFWMGFHNKDVWRLKFEHLDPEYEWKDDTGAVIWRGRYLRWNYKTIKCAAGKPAWFPMEPEFQKVAAELVKAAPSRDCLVVGRLSRVLNKWFNVAADRCGIERVQPDRDLRRSFASMLAARGYSDQYIQFAQGHAGKPRFDRGKFMGSSRPTVDDRHYVRLTTDFLISELQMRLARMELQGAREK